MHKLSLTIPLHVNETDTEPVHKSIKWRRNFPWASIPTRVHARSLSRVARN